jgi:hypothetical protein
VNVDKEDWSEATIDPAGSQGEADVGAAPLDDPDHGSYVRLPTVKIEV